jgi:hypothetical protein
VLRRKGGPVPALLFSATLAPPGAIATFPLLT